MQSEGTTGWKCKIDVRLVGYSAVKTSDSVYAQWPTQRVHIQRSGLHFIVYQKGRLGAAWAVQVHPRLTPGCPCLVSTLETKT